MPEVFYLYQTFTDCMSNYTFCYVNMLDIKHSQIIFIVYANDKWSFLRLVENLLHYPKDTNCKKH